MRNNKINLFRINFGKLFYNKKFVIIFSFITAVIIWFITVSIYDPDASITIKDVPISTDTTNSQIQQFGLAVSAVNPSNVSVTINGPRYKINRFTKDDLSINPVSVAGASTADTFELKLTCELKNIQSDVSASFINPSKASFTFDTVSTKTITLTTYAPNVKVNSGYILQPLVAQPERLTVEGPEQSIAELNEIQLFNDSQITLGNTKILDCTPHFLTEDGIKLDPSLFKYNKDISFKITAPVYKEKQIPLSFRYKNPTDGLDLSVLKYKISPQNIKITGSSDAIENLNEVNLGYIDVRELSIGKEFTFNIPIPSGFNNMDSTDTATVTFDSSNWATKTLSVSDIQMTNVATDYNIKILNSTIKDIQIVGFKDQLESLTSADITATIDFSNQTVNNGSQTVNVNIGILSKTGVWAIGDYNCIVSAIKK